MKKYLSAFFILTSVLCTAQSNFTIEVNSDITQTHILDNKFEKNTQWFHRGGFSSTLSYMHNSFDDFHFEPFISGTFLPDMSSVNYNGTREVNPDEIISEETVPFYTDIYITSTEINTYHFSTGFNLIKRMGNFAVGSGVVATVFNTKYRMLYNFDTYNYDTDRYKLLARSSGYSDDVIVQKLYPSMPIIFRYYLPIGKNSLRFNFEAHLSEKSRMLFGLGYSFH